MQADDNTPNAPLPDARVRATSTTHDLRERLQSSMDNATKAEKAIASYMLTNLQSLPFETASSVAQKIKVSEVSIGRYCRAIGFRHFKDLKARLQADLGDRAWLIGDRLRDFHQRSQRGDAEIDGVRKPGPAPRFFRCRACLTEQRLERTKPGMRDPL